jgi:hypothetical protein
MISTIEHNFDTAVIAFVVTRKVFVFVFYPKYTNVDWEDQQKVTEILFGLVHNNFINVTACRKLYLSLHNTLYRTILSLRPIDSWVRLEPTDEVVTVIFGFREHGNVACVEHVKG